VSGYIKNPGFIEAERISSFTERSTDIDVILDLMIHDIDLILHFVDSPISKVSAIGVPVMSEKVDIANARVHFKSGCVANITASRVSVTKSRKIRIFQEDGYFSIDFMNRNVKLIRMTESQRYRKKELVAEVLETEQGDPLMDEISNFIGSIKCGTEPAVTGRDGLTALEAAYKIIRKL
jgi:predicted dehydrogenase